jgi:signal transduction histidine kinase
MRSETPVLRVGISHLWRGAFADLTLRVWLIVAAIILVRALSAVINDVVLAYEAGELLGWVTKLLLVFVLSSFLVVPMVLGVIATSNLGPQSGWKRYVALTLAVLVSTLVGIVLRRIPRSILISPPPPPWTEWWNWIQLWVQYSVLGGLLTIVAEFFRHEMRSVAAMMQADVDRVALDREMASARLQVLQAQIEPHFLFNTLANVRRLCQTDATAGRAMLDNLMEYLAIALPRMRDTESTLAREAVLIEAYLNVQKIRMGRRLAFSIDIPDALRDRFVPPMMLLTLVENAIKHGLGPLPEGGWVRITASERDGGLVLQVSDTGRGFQQASGGGTGLANIRARLAAAFGSDADLALNENTERGICATLSLPPSSDERVIA